MLGQLKQVMASCRQFHASALDDPCHGLEVWLCRSCQGLPVRLPVSASPQPLARPLQYPKI